jgi:hypothetical protein
MVYTMNDYYSNSHVQARMREFLGGDSGQDATCEYLTAGDASCSHHRHPRPVTDLPVFLEKDWDISRSLWDRKSLIFHLDTEYVNFDFPGEPFLQPKRIFELQLPVEAVIGAVLSDYDIAPLHLLSGRGHHFVWRVEQSSRTFKRLAGLGYVSPSLKKLNARPHRPNGDSIRSELGAAYAGMGLVMEFLANRIKQEASPMCEVPVELTAVEVGPGRHGREMISIDISEYGDPLSVRVIRVPFSHYFKPWQQRNLLGERIVKKLPPYFLIPLHGIDSQQGVQIMENAGLTRDLASQTSAKIPDQTGATNRLIAAYEKSSLKIFHDSYYAEEHDPPEKWPQTYDRTPLAPLPLCVRHVLEHPNDLLLRPANIKRVVRVMLSLGWHPRHIAGLIRSKFERDFGWGVAWKGYDAATRADFYTRLFAGQFVTGLDDLVDFNCQSAKEQKLCYAANCPFNLEQYKTTLLDWRNV